MFRQLFVQIFGDLIVHNPFNLMESFLHQSSFER